MVKPKQNQQPQKQVISIDAFVSSAFKLSAEYNAGLNSFINSVEISLKTMDKALAKLDEENKEIPKLKAEVFELKNTIKILKKNKKPKKK